MLNIESTDVYKLIRWMGWGIRGERDERGGANKAEDRRKGAGEKLVVGLPWSLGLPEL